MGMSLDAIETKKRLLEESNVLIERLKKMRALNADPRLVGINRLQRGDCNANYPVTSRRVFR
jgi:hypothetical protein